MAEPALTLSAAVTVDLSEIRRDPDAIKAAIDAQLARVRRSLLQLAGVHDNEETP